jgi:hypothetical protein
MQHGVGQLEEMFTKGKVDPKMLKQLENELQHRQVPRAVALLADVQAAMSSGAAAPRVPSVPAPLPPPAPVPGPQQPDLWVPPTAPAVVDTPPAAPIRAVIPAVAPPEPRPVAKAPASSPRFPLEDAYKALKSTPGGTWESIEQTRRTLVQQSHPSSSKSLSAEKSAQALAEARQVNLAYATLSYARCGGR